ncbi:hypothetical protein GCK72_018180 [Caenorhabditis remanei]|uniref:SGNH hydrolase-type esterase domain-containing protein n=1 Tax=Caenorhabditis remanei TaxID=31234 RepID=A0A6A5G9W7_CAERE|nr:hypothetical protein GCK72_018180 [Caenorhabditis remanei]KAF1751626.1 hypothetical protein GCK72_018180 [Caenorhabditis remanei]
MKHTEHTPLFPRYAMNPNLQIFLNKNNLYHRLPTNMDNTYEDEYKEYYTPSSFPLITSICRPKNRYIFTLILGFFFIFVLFLILFRGNDEDFRIYPKMDEKRTESPVVVLEAQTLGVPKSAVKSALEKYLKSIDPQEAYPDDVNSVKPHHIRVIGAMGDSLTIGSRAQNVFDELQSQYPGNAYFTGMDAEVDGHLTIYNIFRVIAEETGNKLFGGSTGVGYGDNAGLDVAIGGMKSDNILNQATRLVQKIRENKEIDIEKDWKLVSLWIGTNDVGNLGYRTEEPIPVDEYKANIEKGLSYLKENLPRTIVTVIAMFPPQLLQEAQSILKTGKRPDSEERQRKRDVLSDGYRNASYEMQNEGKFNDKNFTVVVQPFATEYTDAYVDQQGNHNSAFYALDLFHLSKLGHAIIAKQYWQNLFEPVGSKTKRANFGDTTPEIYELDEQNSFIKTVGNSKA